MPDENPVPTGEIILYQTEDGGTRIECRFEGETLWLSQALISELFQISVPTVKRTSKRHLRGRRVATRGNYSEIPNSSFGR